MMKYTASPAEQRVPAEWSDKVLHAQFNVRDGILMACDAPLECKSGAEKHVAANGCADRTGNRAHLRRAF
jgi:uncharacterized glyoxalase superfamily protein PhnB